jgi:dTDP-4-amino-4,6-dideoxygalactose transaminase
MGVKFLDLHKQYLSIKDEIDDAISSVIRESAFIGGARVTAFEEHFAEYLQVRHCIGVGNGTDAIEIALEALSLPPGSEVLVPANSFIATSEAVTRSGCRVVFCDCDPKTYTISVADAATRINERTAAIIVVHLYGHPCDMGAVSSLAQKHSLKVIEDCAQAHGAEYNGKRVGGIGDIGTFSFYPGKNLGAYGDGGAIVSNNEQLSSRCRMIANHGRTGKYDHKFEGRNSRLDGLQAAILDVKLRYLDSWIDRRRDVAAHYHRLLGDISNMVLPGEAAWARHVWHLFVVRSTRRDELKLWLGEKGIQTGIHYPIALPKLEAYAYLGKVDEMMFANRADGELLSLPIGEHLPAGDVEFVAETVAEFFVAAKSAC